MDLTPERGEKEKNLSNKLGDYEIGETLGSGGEANVYRARTSDGREVALKHFKTALTATQLEVVRRLQRIRKPGVGKIRTFSSDASTGHLLEMDLIDGKNLDDFLEEKPLDFQQGITVVLGIVDALESAHRKKVVHGDIKPGNVMITDDLDIVVTDFGMSRLVEGVDISKSLTDTNAALAGTLLYMSPEQLEGKRIDFRSDVYSVGKLMMRVFFAMKASEDSSNIPENTPQKLKTIIQKCLKKNPDERFQSMQELRQVLEDFQEELHLPRVTQNIPILSSLVFFFYFLINRVVTTRDVSKLKKSQQEKEKEIEDLEEKQNALESERGLLLDELNATKAAKAIAEAQLQLELKALEEARAEIRRLTDVLMRESDPSRKNFPTKISVLDFLNPTSIAEVKIEKGGYGKYQNLKSSHGNLLPDVMIKKKIDAELYYWAIETFSALPEIRLCRQSFHDEEFSELQIGIPGGRISYFTISEDLMMKNLHHENPDLKISNKDGAYVFFPTREFLHELKEFWNLYDDLGTGAIKGVVDRLLPHLSTAAHVHMSELPPKMLPDTVELTAFVTRVLKAIPQY